MHPTVQSLLPDHADAPSSGADPLHDELQQPVTITLQTLGAARIELGDQVLGRHNALLFLLVLRMAYAPGMAVPRDALLAEFWPDHEESRQRGNLRQALYKLRTMGIRTSLRGDQVHLDATQVARNFALVPSVETFERDITRGSEPYGAFLPGICPPTPALSQWTEQTRESLHGDVRRVLVEVLRRRRERADWKGTQLVAQWLLQLDPLNEDGTLSLAECLALSGSKAEAVAVLDRYLLELGPSAGDIRLPATVLRRRFAEPAQRRRSVALVTDKYLLGRERELSELTVALRRARWHDGSAVLLHAPPGMGKTRLMAEVLKVAHLEGYRDVVMECRESITGRPFGALLEIIPELLSAPGAIGCAPESLTVLRKLTGAEPGEGPGDEPTVASEPAQELTPAERIDRAIRTVRAQSVRHAVVDLFAAVSDERPIFLLTEDAQWLDDASWEVLSDVIQRVNEMRVFIVLTSRFVTVREERPARMPRLLEPRRLEPLAEAALLALVRGASSDHSVNLPDAVERWIIEGCEGNPMMARALLEHWAATGIAEGVPPTLTALIDQRIDRLDAHAQQALLAISLLGQFASLERIKLVLELPVHELIHALEQLELSGCLSTGHAALVITHNLVRQVALRRMSPLIEAALRAAIGDMLEAEYLQHGDLVILHEALKHIERSGRPDVLHRFLSCYDEPLIEGGRPSGVLSAIRTLADTMPHVLEERRFGILLSRLENQNGGYRRAIGNYLGSIRLPSEIDAARVPDLEELIAIADAAYRADPVIDRDELARFVTSVAKDVRLPLTTRIRAAEVGLTIAANTCDIGVADACYGAVVEDFASSDVTDSSQRISLLYHAIFGDLGVAERAAKEIIRRCDRRAASTVVLGDLGRAAFALRLCGDVDTAVEAFKKHYAMAEAIDSPGLALFSAWQLALIELERGAFSEVALWNHRLSELLKNDDDPISSSFVVAHFCRCAIEEKNRVVAHRLLEQVRSNQPKLPAVKASAYVLALEIGTCLIDAKWKPSRGLLDAAIEKHRAVARYGTVDYFTAVLAEAIYREGQPQAARAFIVEYKEKSRRERGTFSRALTAIAKKLGLP